MGAETRFPQESSEHPKAAFHKRAPNGSRISDLIWISKAPPLIRESGEDRVRPLLHSFIHSKPISGSDNQVRERASRRRTRIPFQSVPLPPSSRAHKVLAATPADRLPLANQNRSACTAARRSRLTSPASRLEPLVLGQGSLCP